MVNSSFYTNYLFETKFLKRIHLLLKNLCGLDLLLLDTKGNTMHQFSLHKASSSQNTPPPPSDTEQTKSLPTVNIDPAIIEQCHESMKFEIFNNKDNTQHILVPIVFRESVVGFLYTVVEASHRLNKSQISSIANFLMDSIAMIVNYDVNFVSTYTGNPLTHQRKIINKALEYIKNNYHCQELTLMKVAEENSISYHYLSRLFKKELKTTFTQHLNQLRVDVASRMLKDKSLSISQISFSCGFDDSGYFCKVFKKMMGCAPTDYRSKIQDRRRPRLKKNLKTSLAIV